MLQVTLTCQCHCQDSYEDGAPDDDVCGQHSSIHYHGLDACRVGGESAHASSCMVATNSWVKLVEGQAGCSIILTSIAAVHRAVSSDLDWLHLLHCRA